MKFFYAPLLCLGLIANAHAVALPGGVRDALKQAHIPQSGIGIEVREINARSALISVNARQAMNPASTMKLLTTYAGLELLGPGYTWKTEAYLDGKLDKGVLQGNLILKGYGDPKFTIEQFWLWLSELRARGLREIQGDLVLDRSFFNLPAHDPADFDNDPVRAYNVGPDALLLNFNTLRLRYLPDGNRLKVISEPPLEGMRLDNQLAPLPAPNCENWDDTIHIQPRGDSVVLQGGYPSECGEREQNLNVMPHTRYVAAVFNAIWQELGGTLKGNTREGIAGGNAKLFATHYSEPLAEVIRDINKFSNNVMARQLFLTLGTVTQASASASIPLSILTTKSWLAQNKLSFPELVLENGAGLSRQERISAQHLAQLLRSAAHSPFNAEFTASLPILGVDGSVKKRLKGTAAASRAHLKTGTLEGVKTIAGYVRSKSGKEWIIVFLINHPNAKLGGAAQDALIEWVQKR
ncbi:MAG: D-alanyl-D-alanine carboxypeptidase/D-alanyl-D-alanine-endopeptidase [Gallionellaceae bacterium]|nr:MAG: D-alanyl-D-alanine carboxypeptidase/D-alanyl-D-alanine-endopeptidase [Gallionellaceae bacterium]